MCSTGLRQADGSPIFEIGRGDSTTRVFRQRLGSHLSSSAFVPNKAVISNGCEKSSLCSYSEYLEDPSNPSG